MSKRKSAFAGTATATATAHGAKIEIGVTPEPARATADAHQPEDVRRRRKVLKIQEVVIEEPAGLPEHEVLRPGAKAVPPRRRGRPPWTADLLRQRYAEAVARTAPPLTPGRIAEKFELLDGTIGTDPEYVASLRRRFGI